MEKFWLNRRKILHKKNNSISNSMKKLLRQLNKNMIIQHYKNLRRLKKKELFVLQTTNVVERRKESVITNHKNVFASIMPNLQDLIVTIVPKTNKHL